MHVRINNLLFIALCTNVHYYNIYVAEYCMTYERLIQLGACIYLTWRSQWKYKPKIKYSLMWYSTVHILE